MVFDDSLRRANTDFSHGKPSLLCQLGLEFLRLGKRFLFKVPEQYFVRRQALVSYLLRKKLLEKL
jgi:hypothetical protein